MEKEAVLEFRLGDELYCFNTKIVKYVFDLEEYEELEGVDEVVRGLVRYGGDAMLLIDTLFLYCGEKRMHPDCSKSVIVVEDDNEALYGMLVDEIVKIEDVEPASATLDLSSEEMIIHHYKERDKLVNEVVPLPLLHAKKIPSFKKELPNDTLQENEQFCDKEEYLLFKIEKKLFALNTGWIKEVVEKENGVFELEHRSTRFKGAVAVRDDVYKVANIKPEVLNGGELIVVEKEGEHFCIEADQVFGIEYFDVKKIEMLVNTLDYIDGFYNKDGEVVAIIDENFFLSHKQKEKNTKENTDEQTQKEKLNQRGFLIFKLGKKDFAIDMNNVRQVVEVEDIPHTDSSAISAATSSNIAFVTEWNHHGVEVASLEKILNRECEEEPGEVIMIELDEKISGVLVERVDDIYYAKTENIAVSDDKEALVSGTLFKEQKLVAILNLYRVVA